MRRIDTKRLFLLLAIVAGSFTLGYSHCKLVTYLTGKKLISGNYLKIEWEIEIEHNQEGWDLFYSTDNGQNWEPINTGMPVSQRSYDWSIPYVNTTDALVRIVQVNSGFNYEDISGKFSIGSEVMTAATEDLSDSEMDFTLFPNIVRHSFRVHLNLPKPEHLKISLHSLNGRQLTVLADRKFPSGDRTFTVRPHAIKPGFYFVILQGNHLKKIRKLVMY